MTDFDIVMDEVGGLIEKTGYFLDDVKIADSEGKKIPYRMIARNRKHSHIGAILFPSWGVAIARIPIDVTGVKYIHYADPGFFDKMIDLVRNL